LSERYSYLELDFLSFLIPLLFSFTKKNNFYRKWKFVWPAILFPGIIFIGGDSWFTRIGVWGFNPRYLTGIYFLQLPLEELLFFICIPYACLFTYESISIPSLKESTGSKIPVLISGTLAVALLITGVLNYTKWYTSVAFLSLALLLLLLNWVWKATYMGKFYFAFLFILIPFFLVNGILTGTGIGQPVVWYKGSETLGIRIGTIPIEDIFYAMLLILMNVTVLEYLRKLRTSNAGQTENF
jgi:lycopene cyclase domain-containing protein